MSLIILKFQWPCNKPSIPEWSWINKFSYSEWFIAHFRVMSHNFCRNKRVCVILSIWGNPPSRRIGIERSPRHEKNTTGGTDKTRDFVVALWGNQRRHEYSERTVMAIMGNEDLSKDSCLYFKIRYKGGVNVYFGMKFEILNQVLMITTSGRYPRFSKKWT